MQRGSALLPACGDQDVKAMPRFSTLGGGSRAAKGATEGKDGEGGEAQRFSRRHGEFFWADRRKDQSPAQAFGGGPALQLPPVLSSVRPYRFFRISSSSATCWRTPQKNEGQH